MIPIQYYWSNYCLSDEDILFAMDKANKENIVVIVRWEAFRYLYSMRVEPGMTFEQCKIQVPDRYGT